MTPTTLSSHHELHLEAMAILSQSWSDSAPALTIRTLYHFTGSCSDTKTRLVHIGPKKVSVLWYTQEEYAGRYWAVAGRRL